MNGSGAARADEPGSEARGRRRIWLCADDYGISTSVNIAIRDLVVRGRINATSAMVVAPSLHRSEALALAALASEASGQRGNSIVRAHSASEDIRAETASACEDGRLRPYVFAGLCCRRADDTRPEPGSSAHDVLNAAAPRVAIGLHLTLTAPFRPVSTGFLPLRAGTFLPLAATLGHALLHRFRHAALVSEITGQLEAFRESFGRLPDFIDGHQHVHLFPQIGDAVLQVAKERAGAAWVRQCGRVLPLAERFADRKGLLLDILSTRLRRRAAALGLRTNPAFAGTYAFDAAADFAALFPRFLDRLPDGSLVMCHPGFVDAELQRLDPLTTLREQEYAFFAGDSFPAVLATHGVALA